MSWWWLIPMLLGILGLWWGGRRWIHARRYRHMVLAVLQALAKRLDMEQVQVKLYPSTHLTGRYGGYGLIIECVPRDGGWLWSVHAELLQPNQQRLLLHGEGRPAIMRELYGMDLVLTGDADFDRIVIMASTNDSLARTVMNPYLRTRFRHLQHTHFQIDIRARTVYAEYLTTLEGAPGLLPSFLDLLVALLAMIDLTNTTVKG